MNDGLELLNFLIEKYGYKTYLEIGVEAGYVFNNIKAEFKIGVNPDETSKANMVTTSDDFFSKNKQKFDLIFVDGLHQHEQVYRDIMNSLEFLNTGGTIVCHDMWPATDYEASHEPVYGGAWNGDCYKALLKIAGEHDDLLIHVLYDFDYGTTIIRKTDHNAILKRNVPEWDVDVDTWHMVAPELGLAMSIKEYESKSEEIVICAIAKQENDYLEDWCKWHLNLGFNRIYIYDNNDADSPETYEWLEEKFKNVEIRRIRGEKAQQILQYKTFCDDNIYKWVAFIDIDEYINIKKDSYANIKSFLKSYPDTDAYILQWHCFHANPDVSPIDKPIYQYCTERISDNVRKDCRPENMNGWYKTISRSGLALGMNEHTIWSATGKSLVIRDCLGNNINHNMFKWRDGSLDMVWINHYIIKNIKDYYYNKYKRGHAGLDMRGVDGYTWWNWNQNINYFTDIQGPLSVEEQKFLMSRGMKPNWTFRPKVSMICHWEPFDISWYAERKKDLISLYVLPMADVDMTICGDPELNICAPSYGNMDFLSTTFYYPSYGSAWMPYIHECETYGQPQIIFNLGYDMNCYNNEYGDFEKLDILNGTLNSFFASPDFHRNLYEKIIEKPDKMITMSGAVEYDENCEGYKDVVDKFLQEFECENRCLRIKNNTYITSRNIYESIRKMWSKFVEKYGYAYNKDILRFREHGRNTLYDAWQFIYPSLVPDLEIL